MQKRAQKRGSTKPPIVLEYAQGSEELATKKAAEFRQKTGREVITLPADRIFLREMAK